MSTLGHFLIQKLREYGVREVFGIPGDFALPLFRCLEEEGSLRLVTFSHEPAVGFAADGAARCSGRLGVACVTYGAGALNMVNPVAGAYAEKSPVVVISGGPGRDEKARGVALHHQVKSFATQLRVYREVTQGAFVLDDPATAAQSIEEALAAARHYSRPVYLEVPRDLVDAPLPAPSSPPAALPREDPGAVEEAADEVGERVRKSRRPVLMVGVELQRFGLGSAATELAEAYGLPTVSSFMARGTFPSHHPLFAGVYLSEAGRRAVAQLVEGSDCLLLLGVILSDVNMGVRLRRLHPDRVIHAFDRQVRARHHRFDQVSLEGLLRALLSRVRGSRPRRRALPPKRSFRLARRLGGSPISVLDLIGVLNRFLRERERMVLVSDTGDPLFASVDLDTDHLVASACYATMGFAVPAALGIQVAVGWRPLVLVGDGAFQMTGPELSQCARYGLNPIVVVFRNDSWEMLQVFIPGRFNEIPAWPFARLAGHWGGAGFRAETPRALWESLLKAHAERRFSLIEVPLKRGDTSPVLRRFTTALRKG
ncbi:MAG: indolepyruvate/phenylpyruvate decarboxylase [Nitrospinota bacterium]